MTPCHFHPSLQSTSGLSLTLCSQCIQSDKLHIDNQTLCTHCLFLCVHTNDETLIYELGPAETNHGNVPQILETLANNLFSCCSYVGDFLSHLKYFTASPWDPGRATHAIPLQCSLKHRRMIWVTLTQVSWDGDSWFHNPNGHRAEWVGRIYRVDALDQWKRRPR